VVVSPRGRIEDEVIEAYRAADDRPTTAGRGDPGSPVAGQPEV
jgi:hypothetical protein